MMIVCKLNEFDQNGILYQEDVELKRVLQISISDLGCLEILMNYPSMVWTMSFRICKA